MAHRLLVTGAGGFVGGHVVCQAAGAFEVHGSARAGPPTGTRAGVVWHVLDLLDSGQLHKLIFNLNPVAVIHAAAMADIDRCEAEQVHAERINAGVTSELVRACADIGAKLIYLSSDTVFDGEEGGYREEDIPCPINFYGRTKVMGERAVLKEIGPHVIARVALVMGLPRWGGRNSFLPRMLESLERGEVLQVPDQEVRSPIDVITLARALIELAGNSLEGCIHLAGNDALNRCEMVCRVAQKVGYDKKQVKAWDPSVLPGRAPRPLDVSLDNGKARSVLSTPMLGLDEAIEQALG